MSEFRIRWARPEVCNGYRCWRERRCIAERKVRAFWLFRFWWPCEDARWRSTEDEAMRDIARHRELHGALPTTRLID